MRANLDQRDAPCILSLSKDERFTGLRAVKQIDELDEVSLLPIPLFPHALILHLHKEKKNGISQLYTDIEAIRSSRRCLFILCLIKVLKNE